MRRLEELSTELKAHIDQKERIKTGACRDIEKPKSTFAMNRRSGITQTMSSCSQGQRFTPENSPDGLDVPSELLSRFRDPDARPAILKLDYAAASDRRPASSAVSFRRKTVPAQKRQAIADICAVLQPKYQPIARRVAESLLELGAAVEEERAFSRQLVAEDAEIAQGLKPSPFFPVGVLSSPDLELWVHEAMESGLIDPTDAASKCPRGRIEGDGMTHERASRIFSRGHGRCFLTPSKRWQSLWP